MQAKTLLFGFCVFLISDLVIFGLMFATYVTMANSMGMAGGPGQKEAFDLGSRIHPDHAPADQQPHFRGGLARDTP